MYKIPEKIFRNIMTELGFPFLESEDFEITEDQIKQDLIGQCIDEYFMVYPLKVAEDDGRVISSGFTSIPFPDVNTVGGMFRFKATAGGRRSLPMLDDVTGEAFQRPRTGTRGRRLDTETQLLQQQHNQARTNNRKNYTFKVKEYEKMISGNSNSAGRMYITWLKTFDDWDRVPFSDQRLLMYLCKARTCGFFATLIDLADDDLPSNLDSSVYKDKADEFYKMVFKVWDEKSFPIIHRR